LEAKEEYREFLRPQSEESTSESADDERQSIDVGSKVQITAGKVQSSEKTMLRGPAPSAPPREPSYYSALLLLRELTDEPLRLAQVWGLPRKIREWLMEEESLSYADAETAVGSLLLVLNRLSDEDTLCAYTEKAPSALNLFLDNYMEEDFRDLIGVNVFNDVAWFNKEKFEAALRFVPRALCAAYSTYPQLEEICASYVKVYTAAEEASGYRLDALIEALTGK
jgi:hypothetical protein